MFFSINPALGLGSTGFAIYIAIVMLLEAALIISAAVTLRKMRELTVTLSDEALERAGGKFIEKVSYHDVSRLDINQKPTGPIAISSLRQPPEKSSIFMG